MIPLMFILYFATFCLLLSYSGKLAFAWLLWRVAHSMQVFIESKP